MSSNINAALDKAEDPEKMVDETLRNLNRELGTVKSETAAVMAEEQRTKREKEANEAEIAKMTEYAKKAVQAGNDADARQFLSKKADLEKKNETLTAAYEAAAANSQKMKQMYEKLTKDISSLEERRETIKSKVKMAKAQKKMNDLTSGAVDAADSMSAFDRLEKKADQMLDQAEAEAQLSNLSDSNSVDDLMSKYDDVPAESNSDLDAELAALKAELGQ